LILLVQVDAGTKKPTTVAQATTKKTDATIKDCLVKTAKVLSFQISLGYV
jgi:hypothetical protein